MTVRGTIIATGSFSSSTKQAAFERGAAPITLIDGEKLLAELQYGEEAVETLLISWERGDLAEAMNALLLWADEAETVITQATV
jgi:hypothetical protein